MSTKIGEAILWLQKHAETIQFGEVQVKIIVHAQQLRIEKSVTIKEKIVDNK